MAREQVIDLMQSQRLNTITEAIYNWCLDGCAKCFFRQKPHKIEPIFATATNDAGIRAFYLCDRCGHGWYTSWSEDLAIAQALDSLEELAVTGYAATKQFEILGS